MSPASALARWRFPAGYLLLAMVGFFPFVRGTRVPLLGWIDLAIHEFGHLATGMFPDVATAIMGNGTQTAVPVALAMVFLWRERDWLGTVLCLGWAAATLQDAALYIGDAPYQRLQLIGGYHDWAFALGELGLTHVAATLARVAWAGGLLLWALALAGAAAGHWIEPALREHGVVGAMSLLLRRLRRTAPAGAVSPPLRMPPDGWEDFYGSTPDRASARRTSLS